MFKDEIMAAILAMTIVIGATLGFWLAGYEHGKFVGRLQAQAQAALKQGEE